jgi:acyl-coenzyme A thioesterase PaaI-like protein
MAGWDRIVHGGITTTILDEIMGWAAIHLYKQLGVTETTTVEVKKPIAAEEPLTAVATALEAPGGRSVGVFRTFTSTTCTGPWAFYGCSGPTWICQAHQVALR